MTNNKKHEQFSIPLTSNASINGMRLIEAVRKWWRPLEKPRKVQQVKMQINYNLIRRDDDDD